MKNLDFFYYVLSTTKESAENKTPGNFSLGVRPRSWNNFLQTVKRTSRFEENYVAIVQEDVGVLKFETKFSYNWSIFPLTPAGK